jgi:hypothetical protein
MVGGPAAAGAGPGTGGGTCDDLATQRPFLKSCQGKHPLSVAMLLLFDCEWAGSNMEDVKQARIAIVAEKRVMLKIPSPTQIGRNIIPL